MDMLTKKDIMDEILNIRYKSPEKERELCFELLSQSDDDYSKAFARTYLADALHSLGLLESAIRECQMALEITEKNQYEKLSLTLYNLAGIIYTHIEDEQGALDYYFKGINLAKEMQDYMMCGALLANIAFVYRKFGAYDKASVALEKAYNMAKEAVQNDAHVEFSDKFYYKQTAGIALQKKEPDVALPLLQKVDPRGEYTEDTEMMTMYAVYYTQKNEKERSLSYLNIVMNNMENEGNEFERLSYYFDVIDLYLELQEFEKAQKVVQKAKNILRGMNISAKWVKLANYEVEISKALGDENNLQKAYQLFYEKDTQFDENRKQAAIKRLKKRIELQSEIDKRADMEAAQAILITKSERDELTGIFNRRGIRKYLSGKYCYAQQQEKMFAVMIVDVDYFKEFNDTYGHLAGDDCLKQIAGALTSALNDKGIVGRYGGDEFLVAVTDRKTEEITDIIINIRQKIKNLMLENVNSKISKYLTVTIGAVNAVPGKQTDILEYMHAADTALYEIKKDSKNGFLVKDSLYKEKE